MFNINQFTIIGEYIKVKVEDTVEYLFIKIDNDLTLKLLINSGIKEKLNAYCSINETIVVKGYISASNTNESLLYVTKLIFLSQKN